MQVCVTVYLCKSIFNLLSGPMCLDLKKMASCSSPNDHAVLYLNTVNRRVVQMLNEGTRSAGFRKSASLTAFYLKHDEVSQFSYYINRHALWGFGLWDIFFPMLLAVLSSRIFFFF